MAARANFERIGERRTSFAQQKAAQIVCAKAEHTL